MKTLTFKDCDFEKSKPFIVLGGSIASLLNTANQYAASGHNAASGERGKSSSATAMEHIGSITETWNEAKPKSKKEFLEAHEKRNPGLIGIAKRRLKARLQLMVRQLAEVSGMSVNESEEETAIHEIVDRYVDDLVCKSYTGKRIEDEILKNEAGTAGFTPASAKSEKENVDGVIQGRTYSIKPDSYTEKQIHELGVDVVITYDVSFDKKTCTVTVNYEIHEFAKGE